MEFAKFLDELGYSESPHFLRRGTAGLRTAPEFGHVFRKATLKPCNLEGVYSLRRDPQSKTDPVVPVVYVCRADSEQAADKVHELVWNQDVVPFLLVHSPREVRLYSGFRCQPQSDGVMRGVLRTLTTFNEVSQLAESFHADAIDSGKVWRDCGRDVTPETRVDWKLLGSLQKLDGWLRKQGGLEKDVSHALIGKYVYLHYLRDRKILSPDRLAEWGLDAATIFGQTATRRGLQAVNDRLNGWLNGSVFPLKLRGQGAPDDKLISRVAATFDGDEMVGERDWQLHLDFRLYDFSYIPIETLSVIYEQFLHAPEEDGRKTKGEEAAAYYTPIPVVNFMLSEMDERLPLKRGMKVFDPACGSGAFLVQSYRRLIEREFPDTKKKPTPQQLRELLESHIYGVDNDEDACSVTELSLILTLLDYIDPPDLLPESATNSIRGFKLPTLRDQNVFHTNFFKLKKTAKDALAKTKFDWIVGNPPWKGIDPKKLIEQDEPVWKWMSDPNHKSARPCGGYQVAQAFAWRACDFLAEAGVATLLLPAMTLFEDPSRKFRSRFFIAQRVTAVANFSNLAEVLFAGRSRVPAAAFFFGPRSDEARILDDEYITVFSPLVANQEVTRPVLNGERSTTWSLLVTANEIRDLPTNAIASSGKGLPWKLACWGTPSDRTILNRLENCHSSIEDLEELGRLTVSGGPDLRAKHVAEGEEATEPCDEVKDHNVLVTKLLDRLRHVFWISSDWTIPNSKSFLRKKGGRKGLKICTAPHVVVSAARNFAVFSDEYLVVPSRQIGIVSSTNDVEFLKALSLYLSSDFAFYHQFFRATQFGVQRGVATLDALRAIPVPIAEDSHDQLKPWVELHTRLLKMSPVNVQEAHHNGSQKQKKLFDNDEENLDDLLIELNDLVYDALGLDERERALVHDLVHVRLELNDGKIGKPAVRPPKTDELKAYAKRLKKDLDAFVDRELEKWHQVGIVYDKASAAGMIQVDLIADKAAAREPVVVAADSPTAKQLEKARQRLRKQHSQWVYFDRNLRIYEGTKTFVFKPLQRFHWTESQAMQDASEIIAETLQLGDDSP
ncbi:MAG: N-6 DNA methylase [Planctomycetia bacterium]|nr:N-6 DNA methylase [Planctomycetia bacterium]